MEPQALSGARVPQPSGCVDSIQKRFEELLRGAVSEFPSGTSVELVGSSENILVSVLFKRCPLGDKSPKQAVVALVLGALPGGVGMSMVEISGIEPLTS